jgi:hypothetical protein
MKLCMKPKQKGETASFKKPDWIYLHCTLEAYSACDRNPPYTLTLPEETIVYPPPESRLSIDRGHVIL